MDAEQAVKALDGRHLRSLTLAQTRKVAAQCKQPTFKRALLAVDSGDLEEGTLMGAIMRQLVPELTEADVESWTLDDWGLIGRHLIPADPETEADPTAAANSG